MVIFQRNPVASALSLVMAFVFQAALFVTLESFFLAAVQVIVYAGAVMVLFLFIIMLLDLEVEKRGPIPWLRYAGLAVLAAASGVIFDRVLNSIPEGHEALKWGTASQNPGVIETGQELFTNYLLPFESTAVLLLVATVGVILLSKRELA